MKVNEMVFFDMLRNIKKGLDDAYMHVLIPTAPVKTIEDHKSEIRRYWDAMKAVKEAKDDLDLLLSLTMEDPQHIAQQGQHSLKKDALYQLLNINKPMPRPPIGTVMGHPVAVEKEEAN